MELMVRKGASWRRASVIWSALTLVAAALPSAILALGPVAGAVRSGVEPNGVRAYAALGLATLVPATALVFRRWRSAYRAAVVVGAVVLSGLVVLGGLAIGLYFLPAAVCALCAAGTESLARTAG
jgi:hypothetical protein